MLPYIIELFLLKQETHEFATCLDAPCETHERLRQQDRSVVKSLCFDLTSKALWMAPTSFTNPCSLDAALVATRGSHPRFILRELPTRKDLGVLKTHPYPIFKPELGQGAGVFWISTWTLQDLWCEASSDVLSAFHWISLILLMSMKSGFIAESSPGTLSLIKGGRSGTTNLVSLKGMYFHAR